jgi:tetratricopeptide (TPR) repeat protein
VLVMRAPLRTLAAAAFTLAAMPLHASERAGPIEFRPTPCLTAKLNPKLGKTCEPPPLLDAAAGAERSAAHLRRALYFIDMRDNKTARDEIDAGLAINPDDFELRLLSARLAITVLDPASYDAARAERDVKLALKLRPRDSDARATYIAFMRGTVHRDYVLRLFDELLADNPRHDYSRLERAKLLQELGHHRAAIRDFDILAAKDPARILPLRGESHIAVKDYTAAVDDFTDALRINPNDLMMLTARADAYERLGEDDKALADYDAILGPVGANTPRYALGGDRLGRYWVRRALLFVRLERHKDAATDMISALLTGKSSIARAQVILRQNGFPEVPLDGRDSPALRNALQVCFGLKACSQAITRAI